MAFDPFTFAAMGVFQLVSGSQQAAAINSQARISQAVNELNAEFAELDAFNAERDGFSESAKYQTVIDSTIAEQRVGFAARDVDITTGSAAQIEADTRVAGMLNAQSIRTAARNKALGFKVEASNLRFQGRLGVQQARISAQAAQTGAALRALGTGAKFLQRNPGARLPSLSLPSLSRVGSFFAEASNVGRAVSRGGGGISGYADSIAGGL